MTKYIIIGIIALIAVGILISCSNKKKKSTTEKKQSTENSAEQNPTYYSLCRGLIGCLFILRGLGLGIPYVSPSKMSLFMSEGADCF